MSAHTKIEWCGATVNHWAGCTAVSPACDNCYARSMAGRLWGTEWGTGKPRHQFAGAADTLLALDRKAKRLGQPLRVFHNSLSDFFDNEVPVAWRVNAMWAIANTPNLTHLLLTKRIGNAHSMLNEAVRNLTGGLPTWWNAEAWPHVWIGATVVNQEEADRDIPKLLAVPAAKRFLSMEPLLGPVELGMQCENWSDDIVMDPETGARECCKACDYTGIGNDIDWVIVGGESGPKARPMHPDWARSLRDQCQAAGVPFLFKQWGEFLPAGANEADPTVADVPDSRLFWSDGEKWDRFDGQRAGVDLVARVGKKAAGRMLNGRTWDEVPA